MHNQTSFPSFKRQFSHLILIVFFAFSSNVLFSQSTGEKILELMNILSFAYVDTVNMEHLSETAIISMLAELDPHSSYIPKKQVQEMNESLLGSFDGIGVQFDNYRDTILVVTSTSGGPAQKLGIRSGDKIIYADGQLISGVGMTDEKVISILRGKKGSQVSISLKRTGVKHLIDYLITREEIPIKSVDASFIIQEEIGYIKINRFAKTTLNEFNNGLKKLLEDGMKNLILDLRGNGGGYLYSAVEIADEFLDGKDLIVSTKGLKQTEQSYNAKPKGNFTKGKLVVLIDEGTASASEILAGAIQDWDRGIIMGRRSFGKGLVMKPFTFSDGSMIRLTTSRYYTPSGRCIQKDYGESKKDYDEELNKRLSHGEMYSVDSISIPKDDIYKTAKGRSVYGGGGILPDIFIPADTIVLGDKYQEILQKGDILEFTLEYTNLNRNHLTSFRNEFELLKDEDLTMHILDDYQLFLSKKSSPIKSIDAELKNMLSIQLKAFIAQQLWGDESYYKIISLEQNSMNKAIETINNWDLNWEKLSQRNK